MILGIFWLILKFVFFQAFRYFTKIHIQKNFFNSSLVYKILKYILFIFKAIRLSGKISVHNKANFIKKIHP